MYFCIPLARTSCICIVLIHFLALCDLYLFFLLMVFLLVLWRTKVFESGYIEYFAGQGMY